MPDFNSFTASVRLTRDPETRTVGNNKKLTKVGACVSNDYFSKEKKEWVKQPCWLDLVVWEPAADVMEHAKKGDQFLIAGSLQMDEWTDKASGQKRTKLVVKVNQAGLIGAPQKGISSSGGSGDGWASVGDTMGFGDPGPDPF